MPRTIEGVDYLVALLTSPWNNGNIGSSTPLLGPSLSAVKPAPTDTGLQLVTPPQTPAIVAHTSGASSFTLISPDTVVRQTLELLSVGWYVDPSPDGVQEMASSLVAAGLFATPLYVQPGDHVLVTITVTI